MPFSKRTDHRVHEDFSKRYFKGHCPKGILSSIFKFNRFNLSNVTCPYSLSKIEEKPKLL